MHKKHHSFDVRGDEKVEIGVGTACARVVTSNSKLHCAKLCCDAGIGVKMKLDCALSNNPRDFR